MNKYRGEETDENTGESVRKKRKGKDHWQKQGGRDKRKRTKIR